LGKDKGILQSSQLDSVGAVSLNRVDTVILLSNIIAEKALTLARTDGETLSAFLTRVGSLSLDGIKTIAQTGHQ